MTLQEPRKLRTAFGADDDLQAFAESWLARGGALTGAVSVKCLDNGTLVACLYRDDRFQVEMFCCPPGLVIPAHTHPRVDTIEVNVAGPLRLQVNGVPIYGDLSDERVVRASRGKGIRIDHDDAHGTAEPVGKSGAIFLSIQRWVGEPDSVVTDYKGAPGWRMVDAQV